MSDPATADRLRRLPAVGALLKDPALHSLQDAHGRPLVTRAVRQAVQAARRTIMEGREATVHLGEVEAQLQSLQTPSLRPVINATGVVLHTNLGRARLAPSACEAAHAVAAGYSSLEMDVQAGTRGDRHAHVHEMLAELLHTDGGLAFNNCAGATFLMLAALCRGKEVIVARGELVEIGGGFRVPDVLRESGAQLVEVGTTNKVYARDYAEAITEQTGAILVVHRSNFALVGFTAQPSLQELSEVAKAANVQLLVDQGSGLLASDEQLGPAAASMSDEPRPREVLAQGADLVAFSGDKLLGGPQAGLLAGRKDLLSKAKKHPLARALRADKMTLAALEATLTLYRDDRTQQIPTIRDLSVPLRTLQQRAARLVEGLNAVCDILVDSIAGESVPGGGSLPLCRLPTCLVQVGEPGAPARRLAQAMRAGRPSVFGRVIDDRVTLDVRTLSDPEINEVVQAVAAAHQAARDAPESEAPP